MTWSYINTINVCLKQARAYYGKKQVALVPATKTVFVLHFLIALRFRSRLFFSDNVILKKEKTRFCGGFSHLSAQARECEASIVDSGLTAHSHVSAGLPVRTLANGTDFLVVGGPTSLASSLGRTLKGRHLIGLAVWVHNLRRRVRYRCPAFHTPVSFLLPQAGGLFFFSAGQLAFLVQDLVGSVQQGFFSVLFFLIGSRSS